jgi:hypothetical protein
MLRLERCLPLISKPYSGLVVAAFKVNFLEDLRAEQLILHIIQAGNWEPVFFCDPVDCSAVNTHAPKTIFLQ